MLQRPYSFRLRVPPSRWRLRLALVIPILLFGWLAVRGALDAREPAGGRIASTLLFGLPALGCLWWTWKQRLPTKAEATEADWAAAEAMERKTP